MTARKNISTILTGLFLIITIANHSSYSQQSNEAAIDSLSKKIETIDKKINEDNYVRVPKKDLEDKLTYMVANEVENKITSWLLFISVVLGAIGGVAIYATRQYIKEKMNKDFTILIDETFEKNLSVFKKELELIKNYNLESRKSFFETELERIKNEIEDNISKKIRSEEPFRKLVALLEGLKEINYDELIPDAIDEIVNVCYDLRMYDELDNYVKEFASYDLKAQTYLNAALVPYNKITTSGAKGIRIQLLNYLDKSLNKIHDYGEAKGIKLVVFMIDYDRATSDKDRQKAMEATGTLIKEINRSIVTPLETVRRLNADKNNQMFSKYINLLYELFPAEMQIMEENASKAQQLSAAANSGDPQIENLMNELYPNDSEDS